MVLASVVCCPGRAGAKMGTHGRISFLVKRCSPILAEQPGRCVSGLAARTFFYRRVAASSRNRSVSPIVYGVLRPLRIVYG